MGNLSELLAQYRASKAPARPAPSASLSSRLGITRTAIDPDLVLSDPEGRTKLTRHAVQPTDELLRIRDLPRRPRPTEAELDALVAKWNGILGIPDHERGPCTCVADWGFCIKSLNRLQAWGCEDASTEGGLVAKMAVGSGKTGLDALLGMVIPGVTRILLLLKPALVDQFLEVDYPQWRRHFKVPNLDSRYASGIVPGRPTLFIYSHADIQQTKNSGLIKQIDPDLIAIDESQHFANRASSRTTRLFRFFEEKPTCKFAVLSGSMSTKGIKDYAHHAALALRERTPLPVDEATVSRWAKAIDPAPVRGVPAPIGALRVLCAPGEDVAAGVGRRVLETRGVISSEESSVDTPLQITTRRPPPLPDELRKAFYIIHQEKTRPDGEEPDTPFRLAQWARQLSNGFYYRWRFPRGEPEELIKLWFARRKNWHKELRDKQEADGGENMDSPQLLTNAAARHYGGYRGPLPTWAAQNYREWKEIEGQVSPVSSFVWVSDHMLDDAEAWADERRASGEGGIIWCEFREFGSRLAQRLGVPYYNGGDENAEALRAETGKRVIVCSIKGHGTGTNLQRFRRHLVTSIPADAGIWEQLLGRAHRHGQTETVQFEVYRHTPELRSALEKAVERAEWIYKMDKCEQKLLIAERDF